MDAWPATVPSYLMSDGYSDSMPDGRIVSPMDAGPPQVRRRSTAAVRLLRGSITMEGSQREDLEEFINDTLIGGTLPFTFRDPLSGSSIPVMFGNGLPTWSNRGGDIWVASLDLLCLPDLPSP